MRPARRSRAILPARANADRLPGRMFFTAINKNQALIGEPPILDPPERPVFGPNPVGELRITEGKGGIALKLSVATAPTAHILVYGARPYNAGRKYCDKFVYLGLLPAPEGGGERHHGACMLRSTASPGPIRGSISAPCSK